MIKIVFQKTNQGDTYVYRLVSLTNCESIGVPSGGVTGREQYRVGNLVLPEVVQQLCGSAQYTGYEVIVLAHDRI